MNASIKNILDRKAKPQRWDIVSAVHETNEICQSCEWRGYQDECRLLEGTGPSVAGFCPGFEDQLEMENDK